MQTRSRMVLSLVMMGGPLFVPTGAGGQPAPAPGPAIGSLGNCCVDQIGPGCNDPACEQKVCAEPSFSSCCDSQWDCVCALQAIFSCPNLCTTGPNDCCINHDSPGCSDPTCQGLVCAADSFCCSGGFWDSQCAAGLVGGGGEPCTPDPNLGAENLCGDLCHVEGDCARDFIINLDDHGAFLLCVTGAGGGPVTGRCTCADLDTDGDVDLHDWGLLQIILNP